MRKAYFLLSFFFLLLSCTNNYKKTDSGNSARKEVMDIAIKYARDKFNKSKESVAQNGVVTISDSLMNLVTIVDAQLKYVIDPAKIVFGLIDDDTNEDAMITVFPSKGQYLEVPEHMILIKSDGKFILNRVIESDMNILGIKERIITAEVLTRSRNSPLRDCSVCKEVVKFQFRQGNLIRME